MASNTGSVDNDEYVQSTLNKYRLSTRGAYNFAYRDVWGPREKSMGDPWSPTNPTGTYVSLLSLLPRLRIDRDCFAIASFFAWPRIASCIRRLANSSVHRLFFPSRTSLSNSPITVSVDEYFASGTSNLQHWSTWIPTPSTCRSCFFDREIPFSNTYHVSQYPCDSWPG